MKQFILFSLATILWAGHPALGGISSTLVTGVGSLGSINALLQPQNGVGYAENLNKDIISKHRAFRVYSDEDFQYKCLEKINHKRHLHQGTKGLLTGYNFTKYTVDRAHSILRDIENKQDISKGRYQLGESFFWYYDPNKYRSVEDAVNTWYSESRNYDYNRPGFSAKTGGFTQLVWKGSREVSCAKIEYETRDHFKTLLVCNYYPAGNVNGEFPYNVMPLRKGGGNRPDYDEPDYPNRPNRPDRPDRPDRPSRPDRPDRPDYDPRPPNRPERPDRPDYDPRPPHRPSRPDRPDRPDYDGDRPNHKPGNKPRPPYDEDDYDRPSRPGHGGSGGGYPTHPVLVSGSQQKVIIHSSVVPVPSGVEAAPAKPEEPVAVAQSAPAVPVAPAEPTPVQYSAGAIPPAVESGNAQGELYEPVEAILVLPQYSNTDAQPPILNPTL